MCNIWERTLVKLIVGLLLLALVGTLFGCATLVPDTLTLDAAHTEHEWGSGGYDYGKDTAGIGEHWKHGALSIDAAQYGQQCKDGWRPEWSARASYAIPLK